MKFRYLILITLIPFSLLSVSAKMRKLDLSSQGISDVSSLDIPNSIKKLNLLDNNIQSLDGLILPTNLKSLLLGSNEITALEGFIPNQRLENLDLSFNPGINLNNFPQVVSLTSLSLAGNLISDETFNFSQFETSLERFVLAANNIENIDLSRYESLKFLNIKSMFSVPFGGDGRQIDYSKYTFPPNLEELEIGNVSRSDDFTTLTLPENLKKLSLFAVSLSDEEFQTLTLSPNLKVINLKQNRLTTLDGIDFPDSIRRLNLQKNNFSKQEKRKIKKRFGKKVKVKF